MLLCREAGAGQVDLPAKKATCCRINSLLYFLVRPSLEPRVADSWQRPVSLARHWDMGLIFCRLSSSEHANAICRQSSGIDTGMTGTGRWGACMSTTGLLQGPGVLFSEAAGGFAFLPNGGESIIMLGVIRNAS